MNIDKLKFIKTKLDYLIGYNVTLFIKSKYVWTSARGELRVTPNNNYLISIPLTPITFIFNLTDIDKIEENIIHLKEDK